MKGVYVRESLIHMYNLLMTQGIEVYVSQDGLTMDRSLRDKVFRITAFETAEGYICIDEIKERKD